MTALEKIKDMIDFCDAISCHRALYEGLKAVEAELKALQPRSCEGCMHNPENLEYNEDKCIYARECNRCACSYYEPKEQ